MKKITLLFFFVLSSWLGHAQLPLEDFDGVWAPDASTDWWSHQNTVSTSQKWRQSNPANITVEVPYGTPPAGNCAFVNQQNGPDGGETPKDWLVTPVFEMPTNGQLKFESRLGFNGNQGGIYKILITTDVDGDLSDLSIYQDVFQWTEPLLNPSQLAYTPKVVNLPLALVGQDVRVAFYMEGDEADRWMVDNVTVVEQCLPPTNLGVTAVTAETATLTWTGSPTTQYAVEWMLASDTPTGTPDITVTGTSAAISGLSATTAYKFYVRAICGPGNVSDWTLPYTFSTPPGNDDCANAITLTVNPTNICTTSTPGTINSSTASAEANTCGGTDDDDVWFKFVATNTTHLVSFNNITGNTDLFHVVYSGSTCGALTQLICSDPNNSTVTGLTVGNTYYVRVYTWTSTPNQISSFTACIGTPPPPPVNDNCATAVNVPVNSDLTCAQVVTGTIFSATASPEANTCGGTDDDDVWFTFVAASTSHTINLNNISGGTTDLFHAVYSGTCAGLTQMYCSDPNNSIAGGLTIGNTYYVRVYSWTSTAGQTSAFDVCIGTPPPPPANDNCPQALNVPVNPDLNCTLFTPGTIAWATPSPQALTPCFGTADDDVWFSFVATNTTHTINLNNITGGTTDLYHNVYSGACGTLTNLVCSDPNNSLVGGLTVGNTYYIRVYTWTSTPGQTSAFEVCVGTPPPPPANDECSGAITALTNPDLTCTNVTPGTLSWATPSTTPALPACGGGGTNDVWYEFVATNPTHTINFNNVIGSATFLYHSIYSGTACNALTLLNCATANNSIIGGLTVGDTYTIRVWSSWTTGNQTTTFNLCIGTPPPPPANDECANPTAVTVNPDLLCGSVTPGTINWSTPSVQTNACFGTDDDDVWFSFVATGPMHTISFNNIVGNTDLMHVVYSGNNCGSLTQLSCSDPESSVATGLTAGQTYLIRVYTWTSTAAQSSTFNVCVGTPPPPPANDNCAGAITAPVNLDHLCTVVTPGTINWSTPSPDGNTCFGTDDDDVWYEFVATSTSHLIKFTNVVGNTDLYHVLYSGSTCGSMTQMYCSDPNESLATGLTVGQTYTIRVYTWTSTSMQSSTFDLCIVTPPPPPANDECANATEVPVNPTPVCEDTVPGLIWSATASPEGNTCFGTDDDDVWFEFVATNTTHNIELLNVTGGTTDLYHVLYAGDQCGTLTQLYCSDANNSFAQGLTVGNTYKIRVYSWTSTPGQTSMFDVCVSTPPPPPANDECADATVVLTNPGSGCENFGSGTIYSATASAEPNTCFGTDDDDVWFEFVATSTSHFINLYNITGNTTDLFHAVYQGDVCGTLTQMYCSDNNSSSATNFVVGDTYKVRVYSWTSTAGQTSAFDICIGTPNISITVDGTTFTHEQLVESVLFGSPCAVITNVTSITGVDFGEANGIGYFAAPPGCDFPFQDGVILATTGIAEATAPPGPGGAQSNTWEGDADLAEIIAVGGNTDPNYNATVLEFDFMAYTDEFTFDFLFASNEYGTFQCGYSDAFAFILTNLDDPDAPAQNLAVIPGTSTPVSVVTIRDDAYNAGCDDQNVEYFDQYNPNNPFAAAIGFNGQTVPFTAVGDVIPGNQYHIKFVISDYRDSSFNSAVFLGGGSFDVGDLDLGDDLTIDLGTAICNTESATLTVDIENPDLFTYEWLVDNTPETVDDVPVLIDGETEPTIVVTESGKYFVRATFGDSDCSLEGDVLVEMYKEILMADPLDLTACDASGFHEFDMSSNADLILNSIAGLNPDDTYDLADFTLTFHASQADADSGDNPIGPVYTNTVEDLQPIFVRIVYNPSGCPTTKEFDLIIQDLTPEFVMPEDFNICEGTTDATITIVPGTNFDPASPDVTITWTHDGAALTETGVTIPVTGPGIYEVTVNNSGCENVDSVTVTETPLPVADDLQDVNACDVYVLPALSANNRYFLGPDGTGEEMFAGEEITADATIYIYAESNTLPTNCFAQSEFVVNISPTPTFDLGGPYVVCDATNASIIVENANFNTATATYAWTWNGNPIAGGSVLQASDFGRYVLTVTTIDGCSSIPVFVDVTLDETVVDLDATHGCDGLEYKVNVDPVNGSYDPDTVIISWTGPNGFSSSEASAVIADEGVYTVTVITEEGCMGEKSITVENTGCMIPRGISPNSDGMNDNFDLTGFDVSKLSIFNRYGREVYSKSNYKDEWFGQTNGGDELPTGTYFYSMERANGESKTGWVYINRQEN